uniref:Uncharacterized protein n=1 Tax=Chaetoceros debilis TaxID=122233 RepID=A0A7S3Q8I0_9STRA
MSSNSNHDHDHDHTNIHIESIPVPANLRKASREGVFEGPTNGQCPGYIQCNLVVLRCVSACMHACMQCILVQSCIQTMQCNTITVSYSFRSSLCSKVKGWVLD